MTPKNYIQEFIEVLKIEIEELKQAKDNNIILKSGTLYKNTGGYNIYEFRTEHPFSYQSNVAYKLVTDFDSLDCEFVSAQNCQIRLRTIRTLSLNQEIILFLDRTALPKKLLQCFQETLNNADQRYALAARLFNGQFQTYTKSLPNLTRYGQINEYQKAAVIRSFQGDTIIWGPPGTGKTHTIAVAIKEQIKLGHRVLLLSHTNTAVDGAMEELANISCEESIYKNGHLIRMGTSQLNDYPMLSLDKVVEIKSDELSTQIGNIDTALQQVQDMLSYLLKIKSALEERQQIQNKLSEEKVLYKQQVTKLDRYTAELRSDEMELQSLNIQLFKLENKFFQTKRTKQKILSVKEKISYTEFSYSEKQNTIGLLQSEQTTLSLKIADLEETIRLKTSAIRSDLTVVGLTESNFENKIKELSKKADAFEQQIDTLKQQISSMRKHVIEEAVVIGATLSMTYMSADLQAQRYDVLFIDEISMAPLLPMFFALGLVRSFCTLIGDFLQLPPIGTQSKNELLKSWQNRSFFDIVCINTVHKARTCEFVKPLSIQYRMNPDIALISNKLFYGGILKSGDNTKSKVLSDRWVQEQPLVLVDTSEGTPWMNQGSNGQSRCNLYHAVLAATMAQEYLDTKNSNGSETSVGVVVPYRAQKDLINDILDEALGKGSTKRKRIEVNTVHSFQGGEYDIIICDSVESEGMDTNWFFFDDDNGKNSSALLMLNVAVTRAKSKFILLANVEFIEQNFSGQIFKDLLNILRQRGTTLSVSDLGIGFQTTNEENEIRQLRSGMLVEALSQYDQNSFWANVIPDLKSTSTRLIIFCPFIRKGRIEILLPIFKQIIKRGGEVIVYTRSVSEHAGFYQKAARNLIDGMRRDGITVRIRKGMHEKVILIDDVVVWQGSLNLLSHKSTTEQMQRIASPKVLNRVSELLDLNVYQKIEIAPDPSMRCELCKGLLVKRTSEKGDFYGCFSFPNCGFTRDF